MTPTAADARAVELFEKNMDWASRIARKIHRHVPPSFDLSDLTQEAHFALWRKARLYNPEIGVPFQGFAALYVRGAVLMLLRRRHWKDHTHYELLTEQDDEFNPRPAQPMPIQECVDPVIQREMEETEERILRSRRDWLLRELEQFTEQDGALVRSVYLDGVSVDEIARDRQVTRGTVSRRLRVIRRQLASAARDLRNVN